MSNIVWMTKDGARHPCSNPLEVEAFEKAGWKKYEKAKPEQTFYENAGDKNLASEKDEFSFVEANDELQALKEEAEKLGVKWDKRWGVAKLKKALGR